MLHPCRLDFDSIQISQRLVCAVAELMQLTSLHVMRGSVQPGLVLAHWSSLKQLAELKLLPAEHAGLGDAQVCVAAGALMTCMVTELCMHKQQGSWWLAELKLLPAEQAGLGDAQVCASVHVDAHGTQAADSLLAGRASVGGGAVRRA
jgi:hypothetical protein